MQTSLLNFAICTIKSPSVTRRLISQENAFKGVLHPNTKISMFCLFSPSSRGKLIIFLYGCDRCVWFKVKKHYIFSKDLRISHVERFKIFFSLLNLKNHFKINGINSCFYYSWNHPFSVKKYIPMLKSSFTWLDLVIWSWPLFTIGDSNAPEITQNMYFSKYWLKFHDCNPFHMLRRDLR